MSSENRNKVEDFITQNRNKIDYISTLSTKELREIRDCFEMEIIEIS